jgi:hypothetical protein
MRDALPNRQRSVFRSERRLRRRNFGFARLVAPPSPATSGGAIFGLARLVAPPSPATSGGAPFRGALGGSSETPPKD